MLPGMRLHRRSGVLACLLVGARRIDSAGVLPLRGTVDPVNLQDQFLSDQLLAVLHSCPQPLSTGEVAQAAPPLIERHPGCEPVWHQRARSSRTREETCYGTHHIHVRARYAREVYQALRAMTANGQVTPIRDPHLRIVSWQASNPPRFVDELEACLALPPRTPAGDRPLSAD